MLNKNKKTCLEAMFALLILILQHAYDCDDLSEFRYISTLARKGRMLKTNDDPMADLLEAWEGIQRTEQKPSR